MTKTKHNPPGNPEEKSIDFTKVQVSYLNEVLARQEKEFNAAIETVYDELGITEKILQAPPGKYRLRRNCSGLDIFPVEKKPDKRDN